MAQCLRGTIKPLRLLSSIPKPLQTRQLFSCIPALTAVSNRRQTQPTGGNYGSAYSREVFKHQVLSVWNKQQHMGRSFHVSASDSRRRRQQDDDDDDDDDDDQDFSPSLAYSMRREMQQNRAKEKRPNVRPSRMPQNEESSMEAEEGEKEVLSLDLELLYKEIRRMDVSTVLELLEDHHEELEPVHFPVALRRLNQLRRQQRDEEMRADFVQEVVEDPGFVLLCAYLAKMGPHFEPDIVADMLQFLVNFDLNSEHLTVRAYLELLKHSISDLRLDQMTQIAECVCTLEITSQTRLLLAALQSLVPSKLAELPTLEPYDRIVLLDRLGSHLKPAMRDRLLKDIEADLDSIGYKSSIQLLRGLASLKIDNAEMEARCLDQIITFIDKLDWVDLIAALKTCVNHGIYCPDFLPLVASISRDFGLSERIEVLALFRRQGYASKVLLEDLVTAFRNTAIVTVWREEGIVKVDEIVELLHCWSDGHLDVEKSAVKEAVDNVAGVLLDKLDDIKPDVLLGIVLHLKALGCEVHPNMITKLFSAQSMTAILDTKKKDTRPSSLSQQDLYVMLASQYGDEDVMAKVRNDPVQASGMKGDVERAAGGKDYIRHGQRTANAMHIPHLIEMGEDGNLMTLSDLDNGKASAKRIAVLVLEGEWFNRNNGQAKGEAYLYGTALQDQGYAVLLINQESYDKIEERSKLAFLEHKITYADQFKDLLMIGMDNL